MELTDYVRVLKKNLVLIGALLLVGTGLAGVAALVQAPTYSAQTQVFVSTQGGATSAELVQGNSFTLSRVKTYARLATSQQVLDRVVSELELDESARDLAERVSASPVLDTTIIAIEVSDGNAARAAEIADSVASSLALTVADIEGASEQGSPVLLTTVERATVDPSPVSPRPLLYLALGAFLGLAVGVGLSLLREVLDTRIVAERDVQGVTELPVVGTIPFDSRAKSRPLVVHADPLSPQSETFRTLRTNLQFVEVDGDNHTFVVTSSMPGEGKSTTAANLALALADTGDTVILIDADLRKPKIADYLGVDGSVGLTDVLIGRAQLVDAVQLWGSTSLYVLPAGRVPPNPSELLGSKALRGLLQQLESEFDWVIFDAPPLLPVTDGSILAKQTAGVLMVVASGRTKSHQLDSALGLLRTVDAPGAGIVLTMLPPSAHGYRYQYGNDRPERRFVDKLRRRKS